MTEEKNKNEEDRSRQIDSLRDTIITAEKTIQSAKAMLLQLEGKKKSGRKKKFTSDEDEENIVQGTFDGQVMLGTDGRQYPVPANYASKSKLIEGDMLKLTITPDGSFIYKQIGPVSRRNLIGIVSQDEKGNFYVISEGKPYKVLLASVTYFKVEPGDEVVIVTPKDIESEWASIENVLRKGTSGFPPDFSTHANTPAKEAEPEKKEELKNDESDAEKNAASFNNEEFFKEWAADIEEITKEIKEEDKKEDKKEDK